MRVLLLFRGAPGCGKSTFIKKHNLEPYTISPDNIRLMYSSPTLGADGKYTINTKKIEKDVWDNLFTILELRMQNGDFTVIDATNSKAEEMNKYKKLSSQYKYRIYMIDMTSIPINIVKERNKNRTPEYKLVPEDVIDKMYSRFSTQKIPSGIKVLPYDYEKDECDLSFLTYEPRNIDTNQYNKIVHIGDIHGCYTVLKEYLNMNNGNGELQDDILYIFCGDYIDRGIENKEVMEFILSNYDKPNVIFIEGNHEKWLYYYSQDEIGKSKEFEFNTKSQLSGLDKKEISKFYRKLAQVVYYNYADTTVLVTHGGIPYINPTTDLIKIPTEQLIKGVGNYNQDQHIDENWNKYSKNNIISIHGHRNVSNIGIQSTETTYNLEGQVEFGGNLRVVELDNTGKFTTVEVHNTIFKEVHDEEEIKDNTGDLSILELVNEMRKDKKLIIERKFGNISSFNFSSKAFYEARWNSRTEKARGLYINTSLGKIVARGYDKFFKIGETEDNKIDKLFKKIQFPVNIYIKENGFLGLVSYNDETDDLFITTKSNLEGKFADWFKKLLYSILDESKRDYLKNYCKDNDVTVLFEVILTEKDPHIIEYEKDSIILLSIIKNTINFEQLPYNEVENLSKSIGVENKILFKTIDNWTDFYHWYEESTAKEYKLYNLYYIEGFVIEDAAGYMLKVKTEYYNFWKFMRTIVPTVFKQGYITDTARLYDDRCNNFYGFLRSIYQEFGDETTEKYKGVGIIKLRKQFEEYQKEGNNNNDI